MDTNQTITINSAAREYIPTWDKEFAKDVADGSASIRKANITGGNSVEKIAHAETKGISRHQVFLRDKALIDEVTEQEQAYIVVTHKADNPASELRALALAKGLCAYCGAEDGEILSQVIAGQM